MIIPGDFWISLFYVSSTRHNELLKILNLWIFRDLYTPNQENRIFIHNLTHTLTQTLYTTSPRKYSSYPQISHIRTTRESALFLEEAPGHS